MNKEEILIGKTLDEAREILRNCNYRIVSQNGKNYMITADLKVDRYNLFVDNDVIVKVEIF